MRILKVALLLLLLFSADCKRHSERESASQSISNDQRELIKTLPYVAFTDAERGSGQKAGTTTFDRKKACPGYNLYTLYGEPTAYLMNMDGMIVHRWQSRIGQPESNLERTFDFLRGWQYAVMLPTGELLAIVSRGYLLKLDWNSKLVWQKKMQIHHDVSVDPEGRIYALTERIRGVGPMNRLILDDVVQVLNPSGQTEASISLYDLLQKDDRFRSVLNEQIARRFANFEKHDWVKILSGKFWTRERSSDVEALMAGSHLNGKYNEREVFALIRSIPDTPSDVFHANTILPLRAHRGLWNNGDLLISINNLSMVAVIAIKAGTIRWSLINQTESQHQPSMLANGNILLFDNGIRRKRSRVIEIDPLTNRIVWQFDGGRHPFFSVSESGVQRLPNGNTLIVISRAGRAIEVTPGGEIVWEHWMTPALKIANRKRQKRPAVYRMTRLSGAMVETLMAREKKRPTVKRETKASLR